MEEFVYYLFCAMCVGGALGVLLLKDFVNSAMSMLLSMLGAAGLMLLMQAYFVAFIMITVYAGAIMVLFVFIVMLVGDEPEQRTRVKRIALAVLWALMCVFVGIFVPDLSENVKAVASTQVSVLAKAQNYGIALLSDFILPLQIAGVMLLAAMVGVIVIAKPNAVKKQKSDMH